MGTPQSLDDIEIPIIPVGHAMAPSFLVLVVEGTEQQLRKRMIRLLRLMGFTVRDMEEEERDHGQAGDHQT